MRLIDADALVSKCGDYYVEEGSEYGFIGTLKCLVDMQPTIGGWISVKDRLPPDGKAVIGYTPVDGCMFVGFYKTYKYSWQDTAVGYWYILTARGSTKHITKRVTQWMPLPDPPERADMK